MLIIKVTRVIISVDQLVPQLTKRSHAFFQWLPLIETLWCLLQGKCVLRSLLKAGQYAAYKCDLLGSPDLFCRVLMHNGISTPAGAEGHTFLPARRCRHRGLVGGAIYRLLQASGFTNIITRTKEELDLTNEAAVDAFFAAEQPAYVIVAAAKVGRCPLMMLTLLLLYSALTSRPSLCSQHAGGRHLRQ